MKKLLTLLSLLVVAVSIFAQEFTIGDLTYSVLSEEEKTVQVVNGRNATGTVIVPETVTYNDIEYSVTTLHTYAFGSNTNITSIELPNITSIGQYAFSDCSSLTSVIIPVVNFIGYNAFYGCSNIKSMCIGSVEQWCKVNFDGSASPLQCTSQQVDLYIGSSESPATIVELPNTVTEIPNYAFSNTTITSFSAPFATSIGSSAFAGCESLEEAILPKVETIGDDAFGVYSIYDDNGWQNHYCTSLRYIDLSSVTSIGYGAFAFGVNGCSNIESLRIGSVEQWCNVSFGNGNSNPLGHYRKSVDLYIGESQERATEIEIPSTITEIGREAFCNTTITSIHAQNVISVGVNAFYRCELLTTVDLPMATTIETNAFLECSSLKSVNLPSALTIGVRAFEDCSSLNSVSIPSATFIESGAFSGCENIDNLELPEAKEIQNYALSRMSNLKYLSIPKVEVLGERNFDQTNGLRSLRIGSIEQYCNIEYNINEYSYETTFPFGNVDSVTETYIYIGDSETPVTEIYIPESVQHVPDYAFRGAAVHTIHFEGTTPPSLVTTNSFSDWAMFAVPDEAYETYLAADVYKADPLRLTKEGYCTKVVEVEADDNTSKVLEKIGEDNVRYVINLTVKGTINSYDMLIIRNHMTSLRNLDLTEASIVDCDYVYSNTNGINYHSVKDVFTADWMDGLMNVKLPATTKSIGDRAFYGCNKLVSVNIPDGVTSIGDYAFSGCNRINNLTLPQSVTSFGKYAFDGCTGLKEVVIPDGVISINSFAFYNCTNLEKVTIPASVTGIGGYVFDVSMPLTLYISSIEEWKDINIGAYVFRNIDKLFIGNSVEPTESIVIPEGTTTLKDFTFAGFNCIKSVIFPTTLESIGNYAFANCSGISTISLPEKVKEIKSRTFMGCSNLENIEFTDSLKSIGSEAFARCIKLAKIELPAHLNSIDSYAFSGCSNLETVLIPASITEIKDYAFQDCYKLNTVIATTVEPIAINENTFSTYRTATMYSPKTSYYKYYWNAQWNQFLARKEYDKEFAEAYGYKYFYLNGKNGDTFEDFVIDDETGPLHGVLDPGFTISPKEEFPDADFNEGAGMIVGGEQIQELGDIHIHHNGNNGASVIAKANGKVHIDNLYVDITTQPNRWYFFCFPFDINPGEATFNGSHVWYLYDGEARAKNGNGGWKKVASDGVMKSGNGYIFQGAVNGTLTIHVKDITIDTSDSKTNLITYQSENKNDASWNLIGNANYAYYGISDLMLENPVTVYNNETGNYEAVRAGDDDYEFYPFQAFFVQKPEDAESVNFENSKKNTKNKSDEKRARKAAARAKEARNMDSPRKVINLEIASVDVAADSIVSPSDRTRIVVNPIKSIDYETDCDAAKFIAENIPQIYSLGADGCKYAINERPVGNGVIDLVVMAPEDGFFTILASRLDCNAKLRDLEAGSEVDLSEGGYTFAAEATTYTKRFQLVLSGEASGIMTPEKAAAAIGVENGAISVNDADADVKVYLVGGSLVATHKGAGRISVAAGAYVVVVNGQSIKVTVNE